MTKHLHKRFSTEEVKEIFKRYLSKEIENKQAIALLKIRRTQFFDLLKKYRQNPSNFSLAYQRKNSPRQIDGQAEKAIIRELKKEKSLIENKDNPIRNYNYSFIKETLAEKHDVKVSLPTIINRAKKLGIIKNKKSANATTGKS